MNDAQQIRDLIATWLRASGESDISQILPLMDDDVVFLVAGQPPMRGRDAFASSFAQVTNKFRMEAKSEVQEIQVSGDWAYCWTDLSVTMAPLDNGPSMRRTGNTLTVLCKNAAGAWQIFRDANLLASDPS
ncbi:MAG: SgcJ/EcaC family oxidoreductase [bacterium]